MNRINILLFICLLFLLPIKTHAQSTTDTTLLPGDLVRNVSSPSVSYYGEDGFRYIFPHENVFFSWYANFDDVKILSDEALNAIQIGGLVTLKPGSYLVKIPSDPRVYAISKNSELRHLISEPLAVEIFGPLWNTRVVDIPEALFRHYHLGSAIETTEQYNAQSESQSAYSISFDKNLQPYTTVHITQTGFVDPTTYIKNGRSVRFINHDSAPHSITEWDRIWGSGTLQTNEHFTRYFGEIGKWHYYSKLDDRNIFEGSIIVQ